MRPELERVFEAIEAASSWDERSEYLMQIAFVLERSTLDKFEKASPAEAHLYRGSLPPELFLVRLTWDEHQEIVDRLLPFATGENAHSTAWFAIACATPRQRRHAALSVLVREGYRWDGALAHQLLVAFRDWGLVSDPDELRILREAQPEHALRQLTNASDPLVARQAKETLERLTPILSCD